MISMYFTVVLLPYGSAAARDGRLSLTGTAPSRDFLHRHP